MGFVDNKTLQYAKKQNHQTVYINALGFSQRPTIVNMY